MNSASELKEMLEWYIASGVDETSGELPFGKEPDKKSANVLASPAVKSENRQAMTDLAQSTIDAVRAAKNICDEVLNINDLRTMVENFEGCSLKLTASKTVFGDGNPNSKIMLIGEAPGADEDRIGLPFVGRSGKLLDKMLKTIGLDRQKCYITNILPWRPPGNRTPTEAEVSVCFPFLKKQIDLIEPDVMILLGGSAANALLQTGEPISKLRGKWLEYKNNNGKVIDVLATFHPAYLLRNSGQKSKAWADFLRLNKKIIQ